MVGISVDLASVEVVDLCHTALGTYLKPEEVFAHREVEHHQPVLGQFKRSLVVGRNVAKMSQMTPFGGIER